MFAGADRLFAELTLDNLQAFGDLLVIHRGAVAAQGEIPRRRSEPDTAP